MVLVFQFLNVIKYTLSATLTICWWMACSTLLHSLKSLTYSLCLLCSVWTMCRTSWQAGINRGGGYVNILIMRYVGRLWLSYIKAIVSRVCVCDCMYICQTLLALERGINKKGEIKSLNMDITYLLTILVFSKKSYRDLRTSKK